MENFKTIIERELERKKVSPIRTALNAGLNRDAIRSVLRNRIPSVDRAAEICAALGLKFYVGLRLRGLLMGRPNRRPLLRPLLRRGKRIETMGTKQTTKRLNP